MEPTDPPRKHYGLKAREFENLNAPGKAPGKSTEHDVFAMLQQNRSVEKDFRKDEIEIKKISSRRKRDYWMVLVGGNLLILAIVAVARFNPISLLFGFSGVIVLSLSITWIMWFVMDDY